MNPIEFVSAGAGSGKTYRLTEIISDALLAGAARPQGILATTFTIKAAAELRERARSKLLGSGLVDLASAVGQARIGTVNSVCGQLLTRFCFELGLSPDQVVLDEAQTKQLLKATLDGTLDEDSRIRLMELSQRLAFDDKDWDKPIAAVVNAARENMISPEQLRPMGTANAQLMLENWPAPQEGVDHTAALIAVLDKVAGDIEKFIQDLQASGKKVFANMTGGLDDLRSRKRLFESGRWSWQSWVSTPNIDVGAKLVHLMAPLEEAAKAHEVHPEFHADVRNYLELVFSVAADALEAYAQVKRARGVVDFGDQCVLLLKALTDTPEVRSALAEELDLVVVDEFQDTNPLQLAIFVELAKLAKRSVWVGDPKQAIYAFRGTDPALIDRILESIEGWGGTLGEPLTTSRRSTPALVSLTNAVFKPAFSPPMDAAAVCLQPVRAPIPDNVDLFNWTFKSSYPNTDHKGLGAAVSELLAGKQQVEEKKTGSLRPLAAGDIAVLCRSNAEIGQVVESLTRFGVPSASGRPGLLSTPEASFVLACLRRLQDARDTVASALIVSLSEGAEPAQWLNDRIDYLAVEENKPYAWQTSGGQTHALLARLEELRPRLRALTPSEALRLAKSESHVALLASRWSSSPQEAGMRIANVEALVSLASTYEDECVSARRPATVGGLLQWLANLAAEKKDERAVAAEGAVTVLTHHGAKGLEWPVVVLTGLGAGARTALWQVRARTAGKFDAQDPLRGRFVHYWPFPYGNCNPPEAAIAAQASELGDAMAKEGRLENLRLFYVSMTRARDAIVLATSTRSGATDWLDEVGATALLIGDDGPVVVPDKRKIARVSKAWGKDECNETPEPAPAQVLRWFQPGPLLAAQPLWLRPSATEGGRYRKVDFDQVGERIAIRAAVDMEDLGQAVHLCIAKAGAHGHISLGEVEAILARWGVAGSVESQAVLDQLQAFWAWLEKRWRGGEVHVEVPLEVALANGQRARGRVDFLVDTPAGWILLDHKANPRGAAHEDSLLNRHGPQLDAYAEAIERATGRRVLEKWLFLPVAGQAARLEAVDDEGVDDRMAA
ncbi:UvrD-helicase domain-containing protein [Variovorax sp. JS1663]|uniref:UvrD-helicase domain-containing protein n=1 Tax=Variovorax sp. JS1663 TaxID=1851577 RepID=UPI000B341658|nr:UvrD-helicase domain-containing protein [Variovorax sp. JS1663]OUM02969.1 hypothetical protein A8M77_08490 [Variovorax sp. JS1663]